MAFDGKQIRNATIVGAKLANLTITEAHLAPNAVTAAKIGSGAIDSDKLADGAVVEAKIVNSAVSAAKLADSAVTTAKLDQTGGSEAVTTAALRDLAVTTAKIADSGVTAEKLANNAITSDKIADGSVSLAKLAANSVDSSKIVEGSITGSDIAANTIGSANLQTAYETAILFRDGSRAMSGSLDLGTGNKIINLGNPEQAQDAATKAYVDSVTSSLDLKASVRVATTADITLGNATTEVDGITLEDGDRVLVKNQTDTARNGIWVASTTGAWTRAIDANTSAEVTAGLFTFVEEGDVNANTGWVLTTTEAITVGTTGLTFTQFSGAGSYLPGAGLVLTGNQFAVEFNDDPEVVSDIVSPAHEPPEDPDDVEGNAPSEAAYQAAVQAAADAAPGTSNLVARADHTHAIADGSITFHKIAPGAIIYEHLSEERALDPIFEEIEQNFLTLHGGNGPMQGALDMGEYPVSNIPNVEWMDAGTADAVNFRQVRQKLNWLAAKEPVHTATTESITLEGLQTVDGVEVGNSQRVLVKNQANAVDNGVYVSDAGPWIRAEDFSDVGVEDDGIYGRTRPGATVPVSGGTQNAGTLWMLSSASMYPQVGTDELNFSPLTVDVLEILAGATTGVSVNDQKVVSLADPTDAQDAATKAYVDAQIVTAGGGSAISNKGMTAEVTTADGDLACTAAMGFNAKGYVQVFVNGIKVDVAGDKTGDCYFSADDGTTAKGLNSVMADDQLFWNGSIAQYELAATDVLDFDYIASPEPEPMA
jgi:hypothetical protein